jgi:hypothetical protein
MRKLMAVVALGAGISFAWGASSAQAFVHRGGDDFQSCDDFSDDFTSAVPEPTAAMLMGLGLAAVAYTDRLRRR